MKKLSFALFILFLKSPSNASDGTLLFKQNLSRYGINPKTEQAFCFKNKNGVIQGTLVNKSQRIASLTKLFTTLMAMDASSLSKTYKTSFHLIDGNLHIIGGKDPYFEEEKMFFLIAALNKLGISKLKSVTFDDNFYFSDDALGYYEVLTKEKILRKLKIYFNTSSYSRNGVNSNLTATRAFIKEQNLSFELPKIVMSTPDVQFKKLNTTNFKLATTYTHSSRSLKGILKSMNNMSKNWIAEHLFNEYGKSQGLEKVLNKYGIKNTTYKIVNGSGLPIDINAVRFDNTAECATILKVLDLLKTKVEAQKSVLEDILSTGTDFGTLEKRFVKDPELKEGILAKTGTLMNTSSLAGFLTTAVYAPFAILNHTSDSSDARTMQDTFLAEFIHENEAPIALTSESRNTFPMDTDKFFNEL